MKPIEFISNDRRIYKPSEALDFVKDAVNDRNLYGNNKGVKVFNVPCAFDIETSSFYKLDGNIYDYAETLEMTKLNPAIKFEKLATMYVWQLGINGRAMIGRTWDEFIKVIGEISNALKLNSKRKLIIYVHNLAYEFQFMRKLFEWKKVFSLDLRKPIYARTVENIEFRCSYLLTGYSLVRLAKNLFRYKIDISGGDLDYSKIRNYKTPLTETEINYCINDIRVVMNAIKERIEIDGAITKLQLTKTGYVRQLTRDKCLYIRDHKRRPNHKYLGLMRDLQINDLREFDTLQRAFSGGFTHASPQYSRQIIKDVASFDFSSSYPAVMVAEKFPMSRGMKVQPKTRAEFDEYIQKYCCVFTIRFKNIRAKRLQDNPISASKCFNIVNAVENNGRIFGADELTTTITNIDYNVIRSFYTWEKSTVFDMYLYKAEYLPTEFVRVIMQLYADKTELKGIDDKIIEYNASKEMLNSTYGMSVTNPMRDEYEYLTEWSTNELTDAERLKQLHRYNTGRNRFLFYPWGVFITAYARRNLFTAIALTGDDYIYSDTDSIKIKNHEKYKDYFETYDRITVEKLKTACRFHGIDIAMISPKNIEGKAETLGVWDFEGVHDEFITLGAKRYAVRGKNSLNVGGVNYDFSLTVSGLNKNRAIPYLYEKYDNDLLKYFNDSLYIPPEGTGKNIHTYIDYEVEGEILDYLGNRSKYSDKSAVHLEPTDYTLNMSLLYLDFLMGKNFLK